MIAACLAVALLAPRQMQGSSDAAAAGPTPTDAVGSDEPPLPAPPPPPPGRITRGGFTGNAWIEFGAGILGGFGLGRTLTAAELMARFGLRPHRNFGVFTGLATWPGDVEQAEEIDEEGNSSIVTASVPLVAWDVLGVRGLLPLGRRLELSLDLGAGATFERRPFTGRRVWGGLLAAVGLAVWVAPSMSLRLSIDHRVIARVDERPRQYLGGVAAVSFHF